MGGGHGLSALSTRRGGWLSVFSAYRGEGRRLSALFTFREGGGGGGGQRFSALSTYRSGGNGFHLCLNKGVGAMAFSFVYIQEWRQGFSALSTYRSGGNGFHLCLHRGVGARVFSFVYNRSGGKGFQLCLK